jgi:hypothetical protein
MVVQIAASSPGGGSGNSTLDGYIILGLLVIAIIAWLVTRKF